jgi:hypothetical protein
MSFEPDAPADCGDERQSATQKRWHPDEHRQRGCGQRNRKGDIPAGLGRAHKPTVRREPITGTLKLRKEAAIVTVLLWLSGVSEA